MSNLVKKARKKVKITKKNSFLFVISVVLLIFLLIINISDLFSGVLTNSGSLFIKQKIDIPSYNVYAVSVDDFNNVVDANSEAIITKKLGGAGFVYHSGEYFVLVSSYETLAEAQEIQQNLIDLKYNSRIVNIKVDSISVFYKGKNLNSFQTILKFLREVYLELKDTSIRFDKKEIKNTEVNSVLAKNIAKLNMGLEALSKMNSSLDKKLSEVISGYFTNVIEFLNSCLLDSVNSDIKLTSNLKKVCIELVIANREMNNQINTLK